MSKRSDQPPVCTECSAGHHSWAAPHAEDHTLPDGRLITLQRLQCACTRCSCSTPEVRIALTTFPADDAPTVALPLYLDPG